MHIEGYVFDSYNYEYKAKNFAVRNKRINRKCESEITSFLTKKTNREVVMIFTNYHFLKLIIRSFFIVIFLI